VLQVIRSLYGGGDKVRLDEGRGEDSAVEVVYSTPQKRGERAKEGRSRRQMRAEGAGALCQATERSPATYEAGGVNRRTVIFSHQPKIKADLGLIQQGRWTGGDHQGDQHLWTTNPEEKHRRNPNDEITDTAILVRRKERTTSYYFPPIRGKEIKRHASRREKILRPAMLWGVFTSKVTSFFKTGEPYEVDQPELEGAENDDASFTRGACISEKEKVHPGYYSISITKERGGKSRTTQYSGVILCYVSRMENRGLSNRRGQRSHRGKKTGKGKAQGKWGKMRRATVTRRE